MKEVSAGRYAGPFTLNQIRFENYAQSPLGLVPKAGGKMRLIFHLSYDFGPEEKDKSINYHTPEELCSMSYQDLDCAVDHCIKLLQKVGQTPLYFSKSDFSNAFRLLPVLVGHHCWMIMVAKHPVTHQMWYFVDLCLPFGSSRSCALFQKFSDAVKHLVQFRLTKLLYVNIAITNYLDDFLFIAVCMQICNGMVENFLVVCGSIGCPVSLEKTETADFCMIFLGVLLDGVRKLLALPMDKRVKAIHLLNYAIDKRKVTVKFVQQLTGTLNFLNRVIIPGRAFTRGMHKKLVSRGIEKLQAHHHVWLDAPFISDCRMWL